MNLLKKIGETIQKMVFGKPKQVRRPKAPSRPAAPVKKEPGVRVGHVTHFFPKVNAAAMMIDGHALSVGDEIVIRTSGSPLKMKVQSLQINRAPVHSASKGTEVGLWVKQRVHEGDEVYKIG